MTCEELKQHILQKTLKFDCLIFYYKDNNFICNQYINSIASLLGYSICYIHNIDEAPKKSAFMDSAEYLYVFNTDEFNGEVDDSYINLIITCKKTKLENDFVVAFPTQESWQVLDYMKACCQGLSDEDVEWLYNTCNKDIFKIDTELNKLKIFPSSMQQGVLKLLIQENNFKDLNSSNIFDLVNAIISKNKDQVSEIISNLDAIDVEGTGLVTILLNNILNIIKVKFNPTADAESLGLKENQLRAIKYKTKNYTTNQLINTYEFLTSIDYRLKNGELQFTNNRLVDYIICNMFTIGG